eukprot:Nk52_evm2s228 gene=Nk52_evmTU2s228
MKCIIEHMEETLGEWSLCEYRHVRELVGKDNLIITNIRKEDAALLGPGFTTYESKCHEIPGINVSKVCLLEEISDAELCSTDASEFEYYLFGGILGDDPPKDISRALRDVGYPRRHLGDVQMTTDTAVLTTVMVIEEKKKLQNIVYSDFPDIKTGPKDSTQLPFRYIVKNGTPILSPGLVDVLKKDICFDSEW